MDEYKSSNEFITKLETENYKIGSFDVYIEKSKDLLKKNNQEELLDKMPTNLRASIISKENNSFIGFISVIDMNNQKDYTSLVLELENELAEDYVNEIVDCYKEFLYNDLGISDIKDFQLVNGNSISSEHNDIVTKEVLLTSNNLVEGVDEKTKEKFIEEGYNIPNLQLSCTILDNDSEIGIIGLTNLIWSNKRANLQIFIDKDKETNFDSSIIDEYLDYVHNKNIHSISFGVSGSNEKMLSLIENTNMNYYAEIPYASSYNGNIETNYLFQNYPNMKKENGIYLPDNKIIEDNEEINKNFSDVLDLGNGYVAMLPKIFEEKKLDLNKIVKGHINAMQNRDKFTIPLGEDKYMIQEGNGKYGMSKAVSNFSYIVLDKNMDYVGYTNILRENGKNAEIEIAIKPELQNNGIATSFITKFYEELFKNGYMSVTSMVFDFNNPSKKLHEKVAKYSGKRIGAYYINGKLWDMNVYNRVNDKEGIRLK